MPPAPWGKGPAFVGARLDWEGLGFVISGKSGLSPLGWLSAKLCEKELRCVTHNEWGVSAEGGGWPNVSCLILSGLD